MMKEVFAMVILVAAIVFATFMVTSQSKGNMACGLKPLPPLGCMNGYAECVCTGTYDCYWVWRGCN